MEYGVTDIVYHHCILAKYGPHREVMLSVRLNARHAPCADERGFHVQYDGLCMPFRSHTQATNFYHWCCEDWRRKYNERRGKV